MRRLLFVLLLMCAPFAMAQESLSVCGVELGSDIESAENILKARFGEYGVHRDGMQRLSMYDRVIGGSEFSHIEYDFGCTVIGGRAYTYLSSILLSKNFSSYESAKSYYDNWAKKLDKKYVYDYTNKEQTNGKEDVTRYYYNPKGEGLVLVSIFYYQSKGGDYFWYVNVFYWEPSLINDTNDY